MKALLARFAGRAVGFVAGIASKYLWAAIGALVLIVGIQYKTIQSKSEAVGKARADHKAAVQAAADNKATAMDLAERLRAEVERNKLDVAAQDAADKALEDRLAELNRTIRDERAARDEIYSTDQDCSDWRAAPVCPAISDRLRGTGSDRHDG